jgi:hypothetical protein
MNASSETINEIILENLKAAANAEMLGEKEEAAYYRNHASELTAEIIKRGWVKP